MIGLERRMQEEARRAYVDLERRVFPKGPNVTDPNGEKACKRLAKLEEYERIMLRIIVEPPEPLHEAKRAKEKIKQYSEIFSV